MGEVLQAVHGVDGRTAHGVVDASGRGRGRGRAGQGVGVGIGDERLGPVAGRGGMAVLAELLANLGELQQLQGGVGNHGLASLSVSPRTETSPEIPQKSRAIHRAATQQSDEGLLRSGRLLKRDNQTGLGTRPKATAGFPGGI